LALVLCSTAAGASRHPGGEEEVCLGQADRTAVRNPKANGGSVPDTAGECLPNGQ